MLYNSSEGRTSSRPNCEHCEHCELQSLSIQPWKWGVDFKRKFMVQYDKSRRNNIGGRFSIARFGEHRLNSLRAQEMQEQEVVHLRVVDPVWVSSKVS